MREMFAIEAARNSVLPVGGGLWVPVYHPELRIAPPHREWEFSGDTIRMPGFCAPALGNKNNVVTIDVELPENANGVLYALGAAAGGLTCYLDDGFLCYEYNLFIFMRTKIRCEAKLPAGRAAIAVETRYAEQRPAGPLDITLASVTTPSPVDRFPSTLRCCSPPTIAWTSARVWGRRFRSTIANARRSPSTAASGG
jgi:hypothetical protein